MIHIQKTDGTYIECIPNEPLIGNVMRAGGTIYRKSESDLLYIVPDGQSHSAAWCAVTATEGR